MTPSTWAWPGRRPCSGRLNVGQQAGQCVVVRGQGTVFTSPSRDAVEAVLYGLSLAYVAPPAAAFESLRAVMGTEADGLP